MDVVPKKVLVFVHHTIGTRTRSGIQRVVVELCLALQGRVDIDFVKWDATDGQLRYADIRDLKNLFCDEFNVHELINPHCHRVNYRFGDTITNPDSTWLIFPEIPYLMPQGNEIFSRIISQCKDYHVRVAAIFYDLIPFRDDDYAAGRPQHIDYMIELLRCDSILAISKFSADDLLTFYKTDGGCSNSDIASLRDIITPVPLGEYREGESWGVSQEAPINNRLSHSIVFLGTIEPRKQQTRVLRIFNDLLSKEPLLNHYSIEIFGSLHPTSAPDLHREIARNKNIHYHQYSSDKVIEKALSQAEFSVFPSKNEGYGLPIVESLRHGVPCLTASFGAMAEIGSGGGCLLVDVLSDDAIAESLLRYVRDSDLKEKLRSEIAGRIKRSWGDYAEDLLAKLFGSHSNASTSLYSVLEYLRTATAKLDRAPYIEFKFNGIKWSLSLIRSGEEKINVPERHENNFEKSASLVLIDATPSALMNAKDSLLRQIAESDVLCFANQHVESKFAGIMRAKGINRLLPEQRYICGEFVGATTAVAQAIVCITKDKSESAARAQQERLFARIASQFKNDLPTTGFKLAIIISTYNRARFTELNVNWLVNITKGLESKVCIVVVDNASTDDTMARLEKYRSVSNVTIKTNSANVGMLGNLHVTSTLNLARHVWTIGDDDFIRRGAIERVLEILSNHPRVPLIAHNFAVYHRTQLVDDDLPNRFEMESTPLCRQPSSSGLKPIKRFAEEHDNLFTAIYPLVFRSDLVAACFNYPFDGIPFGDLVESVPTTKIILETLADCEGYWLSEIGITGNAHNSWSGHRPRWHLVLMPQVLYLARKSGLDPQKIWDWLNVHLDLFYESVEIAQISCKPIHLSPLEVQLAEWMFQQKIDLPSDLVMFDVPPAPLLSFKHRNP